MNCIMFDFYSIAVDSTCSYLAYTGLQHDALVFALQLSGWLATYGIFE